MHESDKSIVRKYRVLVVLAYYSTRSECRPLRAIQTSVSAVWMCLPARVWVKVSPNGDTTAKEFSRVVRAR